MQRKSLTFLLGLAMLAAPSAYAQSLGTAFTYQGRLIDGGNPADGSYDLQFSLHREESGGSMVAGPICEDNVDVQGGLFTAWVDFGPGLFGGSALWLEIAVRADVTPENCATGGYALLTPRQALTPAPNALYATTSTHATLLNGQPAAFYQNASNMSSGTLADERQSANVCLLDREQSFTDEKHFAARPTFDAAGVPFTVESTGLVNNLNADLLDGLDSTALLSWSAAGADIHNTNAGNVGVGTSMPQARLHIAGVPDNDGIMFPDDTLQVSASPWRVRPDKTFYLDGLVGIGTQDPTALLHLKPTLDQTTMRIEADRYVSAPDSVLDASATATQIAGSDAPWANPGLAGTLNGASATATVTTPSGDDETNELDFRNFGFNVPAAATISQVRVEVTGNHSGSCTSCSGPYARLEFLKTARLANGGTLGSTRTNRSTVISTSLGNSYDLWGLPLTPAIVNSATFGVRLRVRMIPVTTYYDIIHPNGTPVDCTGCTANATVGIDGIRVTIYYGSPTLAHAEYTVGIGPDGTNFRISPSPDFSETSFAVDQTGDVNIGPTSAGGVMLNVFGGAAKNGGGSWSSTSDARLKRNIAPLEGTLDRLLTLRGYSFEYTEDAVARRHGIPGRQMGLIAQEVEKVFPDWIDYTQDGYRMVTERATTALMVEALRDLRAEKDAEIADLKARLDRLEALITRP